jgi:anti-sigma regulatory factor (Ser/Thr protein kinase)
MDVEVVETQLPSTARAPQLARAFLRTALETWKLDGLGELTELLATELVTNVVVHVHEPMTLRVLRGPCWLRCEVVDPSPAVPTLQHPATGASHGRGIQLVDALATEWGVDRAENGKTVWFTVDTATATSQAHGRERR